jgi:hypothetical protein
MEIVQKKNFWIWTLVLGFLVQGVFSLESWATGDLRRKMEAQLKVQEQNLKKIQRQSTMSLNHEQPALQRELEFTKTDIENSKRTLKSLNRPQSRLPLGKGFFHSSENLKNPAPLKRSTEVDHLAPKLPSSFNAGPPLSEDPTIRKFLTRPTSPGRPPKAEKARYRYEKSNITIRGGSPQMREEYLKSHRYTIKPVPASSDPTHKHD